MNLGEMAIRVRDNVADPNGEIYSASEVSNALNNGKDEVLLMVRSYSNEWPQSSTTITFAAGDKEKALPSTFLSIKRVEYYSTGSTAPWPRRVVNFNDQDDAEDSSFYVRREGASTVYLGRRDTSEAITVTVYFICDVSDTSSITTGTTASITFGPAPTNNLIVLKATIQLLAARKRDPSFFVNRENVFAAEFAKVLSKTAQPRYVRHIRGS